MKPITLLLIISTAIACTTNTVVHHSDPALGFSMGMPEKQWRERVENLSHEGALVRTTNADTYKYLWSTKDGNVPAYIRFNSTGKLRAIYITYNADTVVLYDPYAQGEIGRYEKIYAPGKGVVQLSKVDGIIKMLSECYGKPDSSNIQQYSKLSPIMQKYANALEPYSNAVGDTTREHYYWHMPNMRIEFECWGFHRPNNLYPYRYVRYAHLTIKSVSFQSEENVADSAYYKHLSTN